MKIILLSKKDNSNLIGKIIDVKPGYAKNFLLPKKLAILNTYKNNMLINNILLKKNKNTEELKKISNTSIILKSRIKKDNLIYGSITSKSIIKVLKALDIKLNYMKINRDIFIKKIGTYKIDIHLNKNDHISIYIIVPKIKD
jgi:large subunit ribosomal protein L9